MGRRYHKIIISFFITLALIIGTNAGVFSYQADIEDLSGDKYFPKVKEALKNAKSSIYMIMYFASFDPRNKNSSVYQLVQELVNAHKRGVKVKVILDQNISYSAWGGRWTEWTVEGKNEPLFIYLKEKGIEVYYDNKLVLTHTKVIVIDKKKIILGSANWTASSFLHKNYETSVLLESPELARELIKDFSKIIIDYEASRLDEEKKAPVRVSRIFLQNPFLAGRMLSRHDETVFDVYLLFLREFDGNPQGEIAFDYGKMAKSLGLDKKINRKVYRPGIYTALKKLHKRYNLIEYKARPKKNPYIRLLSYPDKTPYRSPEDRFFSIPDNYWRYGWHKRFTFPEKYCYLITLCKTGIGREPWWKDYIVSLVDEFNVSEATISRGMMGLRKLNIIDIEYSDYPEGPSAVRGRSRFRLLGLYSSEELEEQIDRLKMAYSEESIKKAKAYAKIVYKEKDIQVIEDIIKKTAEYGESQVNRAFSIVSKKAPDNPKRSYKYVVGILQTEAREKITVP